MFHCCEVRWGKDSACFASVCVLNENTFSIRFLRGLRKMKCMQSLNLIKPWLPHLQNEIIMHLLQGVMVGVYEIMLTKCLTKSLTKQMLVRRERYLESSFNLMWKRLHSILWFQTWELIFVLVVPVYNYIFIFTRLPL